MSVTISTSTLGLDVVTKGRPSFGRPNGIARLTHGIQRCIAIVPPAFENIQSEPARLRDSVAR